MARLAPPPIHLLIRTAKEGPGFARFLPNFACGLPNDPGTYAVLSMRQVTCAGCRRASETTATGEAA